MTTSVASRTTPDPLTILIIGSRDLEREHLRHRLSEYGSSTASVDFLEESDVEGARSILGEVAVDVILIDLVGHRTNNSSDAAIRALRRAAPHVPIVITTDAANESIAFQAVQAGAQDYVINGLDDTRVLWRAIRNAIERASVTRRRDLLLLREHDARLAAETAREEADAARVRAEAAIRTRDHVLGIVSHDLRNPLSAISLCANALTKSEQLTHAERRRLVSTIHDAVDWTQRLLGDLVDVASIEAGRLSMTPRRLDPIIALSKAVDLFEHGPNGITVRLAADLPEWLPAVVADEQRLLQVLANLITNARKVSSPGASITLGAVAIGEAVRFSVSDTGSGIAPEDQPHIFDWFWRASHERAERGTGLGLAIAKGIVEAHGGRIDVDSAPGCGSTFSFTIPCAQPNAARGEAIAPAERISA